MQPPIPLDVTMRGPEGRYRLNRANASEDGGTNVEIAGVAMTWFVETEDQSDEGLTLSGLTIGSHEIRQDVFWLVLQPEAHLPRIEFGGNAVLWRIDEKADD